MSRDFVNSYCATLPGAEVSDPWGGGHDCWKVGGKMFASIGAITPAVAVKTADIETAGSTPALTDQAWQAQLEEIGRRLARF